MLVTSAAASATTAVVHADSDILRTIGRGKADLAARDSYSAHLPGAGLLPWQRPVIDRLAVACNNTAPLAHHSCATRDLYEFGVYAGRCKCNRQPEPICAPRSFTVPLVAFVFLCRCRHARTHPCAQTKRDPLPTLLGLRLGVTTWPHTRACAHSCGPDPSARNCSCAPCHRPSTLAIACSVRRLARGS